jgi:hypothetical protein
MALTRSMKGEIYAEIFRAYKLATNCFPEEIISDSEKDIFTFFFYVHKKKVKKNILLTKFKNYASNQVF